MKARQFYAFAVFGATAVLPMAADTADEWVARARAYLGSESALTAAQSLHFQGSVEVMERVPDPADSSKTIERPIRLSIDIVFQKPMQQRQILRSDKVERTTCLDGYDAWEKVTDLAKPGTPRIYLLDTAGIKRLRASTIDNLSFYSSQGQDSPQLRLLGEATVDGIACVKLSFTHGGNMVFLRYFDKSSGRLVKTETENGGEIREEGELMSGGIRFPRTVMNKTADGKVTSISFDKVTVNEPYPAEVFVFPSIQPK